MKEEWEFKIKYLSMLEKKDLKQLIELLQYIYDEGYPEEFWNKYTTITHYPKMKKFFIDNSEGDSCTMNSSKKLAMWRICQQCGKEGTEIVLNNDNLCEICQKETINEKM